MKISFDPKKDEQTREARGFSLAVGAEVISNQAALKANEREIRKYGR